MRKAHITRYYNMVARCYDPSNISYKNYGGKGITVCLEWLNDREYFIQWCEENYTPDTSIDRIHSGGEYSPGNCKFSSRIEQNNNRKGWSKKPKRVRPKPGHFVPK